MRRNEKQVLYTPSMNTVSQSVVQYTLLAPPPNEITAVSPKLNQSWLDRKLDVLILERGYCMRREDGKCLVLVLEEMGRYCVVLFAWHDTDTDPRDGLLV